MHSQHRENAEITKVISLLEFHLSSSTERVRIFPSTLAWFNLKYKQQLNELLFTLNIAKQPRQFKPNLLFSLCIKLA